MNSQTHLNDKIKCLVQVLAQFREMNRQRFILTEYNYRMKKIFKLPPKFIYEELFWLEAMGF